jgi:tetratricopeptide (TPR) repeat protein
MLSKLVTGPPSKQGSAGGARAEEMGKPPEIDFETAASGELRAGKDFIASGRFDKAIERLTRAVADADETEIAEARYCLAEAYSLNGDTRNALAQVAGVSPDDSAPWRPDFVLLKGRVLVDASAWDEAVKWLRDNGQTVAEDDLRSQAYFFLLGIAYGGTGDPGKEKQSLARVISASADNELGQVAARLLAGL